ncbi:MAG: replication-associated recombination protein A [Candidatus Obscuribacterales bacterium]|jgi:putative ATPase|nr:replication-associated recombination protein A [Candidatus Obscuribacterales bacterium]
MNTKSLQIPLAEKMRPQTLNELVGQEALLSPNGLLRQMIEADELRSFILWGPPGVGKTTLARMITSQTKSKWISFSAVTSGIKEIKGVMAEADAHFNFGGQRTVLFVDEIHRFNKAQQDAFLPYVESGTILLIGATTENPSFELNSALLSRLKVFVLKELSIDDVTSILKRALTDEERGLGKLKLSIDDDQLRLLATYSTGDARTALNSLELLGGIMKRKGITLASEDDIRNAVQQTILKYDKTGENHYNLISALHKSLRNSDADASLYWLARMLEAGEDPLYIARRLVRFASEDIGLAHPQALEQTVAAMNAVNLIGMPEGKLALAQVTVLLAYCPKSNAVYSAYNAAAHDALNTLQQPVPFHLRNAPTDLMKEIGYAKGYKYAHDYVGATTDMQCLPDDLKNAKYFEPTDRGFEGKIKNQKEENRLRNKKEN